MMGFAVYGDQLMPFFDPGPTLRLTPCDWGVDGHTSRLQSAISWAESLGVRIPDAGRHRQYLRFLANADDHGVGSDFYRNNAQAINYARFEVHEFDRIHRWLGGKFDSKISSRLSDYACGPYRYAEETKGTGNSRARDIGLELAIGSEFSSVGLHVTYGEDLYPEPMLTIEGCDYAIQCKRVSSSTRKSLAKRIAIASKQVRGNCSRYPPVESGAIVLDVTKALNPSGSLHVNPTGQPQFCDMRRSHHELSSLCRRLVRFDLFPEVALLIVRNTYLQSMQPGDLATQWVCSKHYFPNPRERTLYEALDRASPIALTYGVGFDAVVDGRHDHAVA